MLLNHFLRPTISFLPFKSITLPPYCLTTSQSCFYHIYVVRLNICIKLAQSLKFTSTYLTHVGRYT